MRLVAYWAGFIGGLRQYFQVPCGSLRYLPYIQFLPDRSRVLPQVRVSNPNSETEFSQGRHPDSFPGQYLSSHCAFVYLR